MIDIVRLAREYDVLWAVVAAETPEVQVRQIIKAIQGEMQEQIDRAAEIIDDLVTQQKTDSTRQHILEGPSRAE